MLGLWQERGRPPLDGRVRRAARARGVEDVLFVSMDGVSGPGRRPARAIFPGAVAQRCIVHLVRNSCKYVPSRDMQAFCRDARAFYGAPSLAACRAAFADFSERWARYPGRRGDLGAQHRSGRAAVLVRPRRAQGDVHHQLRRERQRELPQGRQARLFPDEDAVMKLLYLRVKELYRQWGDGCHQSGWARVRNQLLCDGSIRPG